MNVEFLSKFGKDIDKITSKSVKQQMADIIKECENASKLSDISNIKKLKGLKNAHRIRIGNYRVGFFYENKVVEFARIVHRKDIYKLFP